MDTTFYEAKAFNQDLSGWRVDSATSMAAMFHHASSFDQDISEWDTSGVMGMDYMFNGASAFDQDLGWCVDDDVNLEEAFSNTPCASTS